MEQTVVMCDIEKSGYVMNDCLIIVRGRQLLKLPMTQMSEIHQRVRPQSLELLRRDYSANGGWETFLSYEDPEQDILVGLLRLRKCSEEGTFRKELTGIDGGCSIVRELVSILGSVDRQHRALTTASLALCSTSTELQYRCTVEIPRCSSIRVSGPF